jgi:hypothetical protein
MSCDFAIWYPAKRLTDEQAGALYERLCEGDTAGVAPHPAVEGFYRELTSKYPERDEASVWSMPIERSSGHVLVSSVPTSAKEVESFVRALARKHGLSVYDPESGTVTHPAAPKPSDPDGGSPMRFW